MMNREFFLALDAICRERRLDKSLVVSSIEAGLASAFKKEFGESRDVTCRLNEETGRVEFFAFYTVVEGEPQSDSELTLEEARDIKPDAEIGEVIGEDVTPNDLSRIAAMTGKQVIMQRINEAIREQTAAEMNDKEGELVLATVRRIENNVVYVEIINSQMEGVMNMMDQVRTETYNVGDKIRVYVKKVRESSNGRNSQVIVSRSCAGFVKKLFEMEVPEMRSGLVKVKNIVREAGNRTKMAVYTDDPNIDPLAACIGPRGERVNNVVNELSGEKIDVINYTGNVREYIVRALNPLKSVLGIRIDDENGKARVIVADDKLSLAIGKGGMNARLAAKLTGYKLDIVAKSADPTFSDEND